LSTFRATAAALSANGYQPVPIEPFGKRPVVSAWQHSVYLPGDELRYTEEGAGVLFGTLRGIDIDVMQVELAARIRAQAFAIWGAMPTRIGQAPKLMLFCRTLAPGFKLQSLRYRLPGDAPDAKPHCVEILGKGQQGVVYGRHGITRLPYTWNGAGGLTDVPFDQLPVATEAELLGFLKWCNTQFEEAGGVALGALSRSAEETPSAHGLAANNPAECVSAIEAIRNDDLDWDDWCRVGLAIKGALGDAGLPQWLAFSAKSNKHDEAAALRQWATFHPSSLGAGSLYKWAQDSGWERPRPDVDISGLLAGASREAGAAGGPVAPALILPIDWRDVGHNPPPPRVWAIEGWLGVGHMTMLAGRGGVGKTLVMQQIASCLALGRDFLAPVSEPRTVLVWCAEDDADELKRRQIAIAEWLGVPIGQFHDRLIVLPLAGHECSLAELDGGRLTLTKHAKLLVEQVRDYRATTFMLDNIAHLYGGDENNRHQVTQFANLLTGICIQAQTAGILAGHPAKSSESEFSGSTAWENAVRGRLYLSRTPPDTDEKDADPAGLTRYLSKRKANYSALDCRRLSYADHVLKPDDAPGPADAFLSGIRSRSACDVVLRAVAKLAQMSVHGLPSSNTPNFLPKVIGKYELAEGLHPAEIEKAMRQLMKDGRLAMHEVGRYANRNPKLGLVVL
jgi:hypothetical protein